MAKELYKLAALDPKTTIESCPVCGANALLWSYSDDFENGPVQKVVMCENGERIGPQEGIVQEGCLLFMPPPDFYQPTIREAVKFWNEFAKALSTQRRERNWQEAKVLRARTERST